MKNRNISLILGLATLVAFGAENVVYAAPPSPENPSHASNPNYKGLKTPHSSRKEAATRLKQSHLQEQQQQQHGGGFNAPKGQGQAGVNAGNNQASGNKGGVR